jgi:hypothetical protein
VPPSPFCAPVGELWRTGAAGGRAPVSVPPCPLFAPASVHDGSSAPGRSTETWTRSMNYPLGNNSLFRDISEILQRGPWTFGKSTRGPNFADFALRPLGFSKINPQSTIFPVRFEIWKIFTKRSLASEKSHKNSSKTSKIHIFPTTTPNPVILVPKFLESLQISFYAFI